MFGQSGFYRETESIDTGFGNGGGKGGGMKGVGQEEGRKEETSNGKGVSS